MVLRGEAILALLLCVEGILPSNRGQDARDTQGRDALATKAAIAKLRLTLPPIAHCRTVTLARGKLNEADYFRRGPLKAACRLSLHDCE